MASRRGSVRSRRATALPPSAQARDGRSPSPSRDATAEHREDVREEPLAEPRIEQVPDPRDAVIQRLEAEQTQLMDMVRSMAVTLARLEKRSVEESPLSGSVPAGVPPPPPPPVVEPPAEQSVVPPPAVGQYVIPPPGMPVRAQIPSQLERGESSGAQGSVHHAGQRWDVDRFLKNGGSLFTGGTDPEAAIIWFDDTEAVLDHMGCPMELRVRIATGAIRGAGRTWWRSVHSAYLSFRPLEQISWSEFRDVFYDQYFSSTVVEEKKMEFLALVQVEQSVAEYHARFLALERFAPGTFQTERQRAARFVSGLRLSLHAKIAPYQCATLQEAVARSLQSEAAHRIHHARRALGQTGQPGRQRQRSSDQGQDQQGSPQRQRVDDAITVHAVQGQPLQQWQVSQQYQWQTPQSDRPREYPWCQTCQRRHPGQCRRCYTCDEVGHLAAQCPYRAQQPQYQPPYQPGLQQTQGLLPTPAQYHFLPPPPPQPQGVAAAAVDQAVETMQADQYQGGMPGQLDGVQAARRPE